MTTVLVQYSHGVLTSEKDPSIQHSAPLPSFNPKVEDMPENPLAAEQPVVTDSTNLIGGDLDLPPYDPTAPATNLLGGTDTEGAKEGSTEGKATDAPAADAAATDAPAADAPAADAAATDAPAADAAATDAAATDAKATGTKAKSTK